MDSTIYAASKEALPMQKTDDDFSRFNINETVSLNGEVVTDIGGYCCPKVKQEILQEEPDDVIDYLFYHSRKKLCSSMAVDEDFVVKFFKL